MDVEDVEETTPEPEATALKTSAPPTSALTTKSQTTKHQTTKSQTAKVQPSTPRRLKSLMTSSPKRWNPSRQRIKTTCRKTTTLKTSMRLTPTNQPSLLLPLLRSNQSSPEKSRRAPPGCRSQPDQRCRRRKHGKAIVNRPSPAEAKRANQTSRLSPRQGVCDSLSNRSRRAGSRPDLGRGLSGKRPSWIQSKC